MWTPQTDLKSPPHTVQCAEGCSRGRGDGHEALLCPLLASDFGGGTVSEGPLGFVNVLWPPTIPPSFSDSLELPAEKTHGGHAGWGLD